MLRLLKALPFTLAIAALSIVATSCSSSGTKARFVNAIQNTSQYGGFLDVEVNAHTLEVKPFTFVGATTRAGLISAPLRSRFGIVLRLEFYTPEDLRVIVERSAEILGVEVDGAGAIEIASRSRGTPRIANRLLRRVRDYAQVRGAGKIDLPTAQAALLMLEVDKYGFDEVDPAGCC